MPNDPLCGWIEITFAAGNALQSSGNNLPVIHALASFKVRQLRLSKFQLCALARHHSDYQERLDRAVARSLAEQNLSLCHEFTLPKCQEVIEIVFPYHAISIEHPSMAPGLPRGVWRPKQTLRAFAS
jgi:hypothetical protein